MVTAAAPSYSHATEPRAVANRSKFRAPEGADGQSSNIMFDRRVVRGSTYAQPIDTPVRPSAKRSHPRRPAAARAGGSSWSSEAVASGGRRPLAVAVGR